MVRNPLEPAGGSLAREVQSRCLKRGWDLQEVARRAGISRTTLSHLLHGRTRHPHTATLHRLARALEIEPERLLDHPRPYTADVPSACETDDASRRFDRQTNTTVAEVADEFPTLFAGWTREEWDELYSTFGTGGPLSREGVAATAERMNRKRATVEQLQVLLETHLGEVAAGMIETLYRMVRPGQNGTSSSESPCPPQRPPPF